MNRIGHSPPCITASPPAMSIGGACIVRPCTPVMRTERKSSACPPYRNCTFVKSRYATRNATAAMPSGRRMFMAVDPISPRGRHSCQSAGPMNHVGSPVRRPVPRTLAILRCWARLRRGCRWLRPPDTRRGRRCRRRPGVHPISGRQIATVMSHAGADWLDRPEREAEEQPDRAVEALELAPGAVVADVGAGSGYFTVRLARRVGPAGRVFAADIQPEMLSLLRARLARERISERRTGAERGKRSAPAGRAASTSSSWWTFTTSWHSRRSSWVNCWPRSSRTGRLVLLEYRKEDPAVPIRPGAQDERGRRAAASWKPKDFSSTAWSAVFPASTS